MDSTSSSNRNAVRAEDIAGYEASMSFANPLTTSVMPRWERKHLQRQKQQQQQQQLESKYGPSSSLSTSSDNGGAVETRDRFIPSRSSMCMDRSNYFMGS